MKLAIMQPYFFPYLGYYQLVAAVDKFVFLDDVNYKRGWMNRNRLLICGDIHYITLPLSGASQNQKICDVKVDHSHDWRAKMRRSVTQSYSRAPQFEPVFELLNRVIDGKSDYLSDYAKGSIQVVADYLGLRAQFVDSSRCYENTGLAGEKRILDIVVKENAADYYNLPGGVELYSPATFRAEKVNLRFVETKLPPYAQSTQPKAQAFQAGLSILDVLLFNRRDAVLEMLNPQQIAA